MRSSVHQPHDVSMAPKGVARGRGLKRPGIRVLQNFWVALGMLSLTGCITTMGPDQHPFEAMMLSQSLKLARMKP